MVCFACLLPLFLVPIVNILPLLLDFLLAKVYRLLGKEYRKPERVPPSCPFKPSQEKGIKDTNETQWEVESSCMLECMMQQIPGNRSHDSVIQEGDNLQLKGFVTTHTPNFVDPRATNVAAVIGLAPRTVAAAQMVHTATSPILSNLPVSPCG